MWDKKDVEIWMVQAQKADRRIHNPGQLRPLAWPDLHVANPDHRRALKLWIWCGAQGIAFFDVCRTRGHPYSTWLGWKNQAVDRIVMLLNLEESLKRTDHLVAGEI